MEKPTLKLFSEIGELFIQQYERYLPTAYNNNLSLIQKVNLVINKLNEIGEVSNDLITQWNTVYDWVMNDGLSDSVDEKLDGFVNDGTFQSLINDKLLKSINETKANVTDVNNSLLLKRDKATKIVLNDLAQEVVGALAGNATFSLNSVPQDLSVHKPKLSDNVFTIVSNADAMKDGYSKPFQTYKNFEIGGLDSNGVDFSYNYIVRTIGKFTGVTARIYMEPPSGYKASLSVYNASGTRLRFTDFTIGTFFNLISSEYYKIILYKLNGGSADTTPVTDVSNFTNGFKIYNTADKLSNTTNSELALRQIKASTGDLTIYDSYKNTISNVTDDSNNGTALGYMTPLPTGQDSSSKEVSFSGAVGTTLLEYFIPKSYVSKFANGITVSLKIKSTGLAMPNVALKVYDVAASTFLKTGDQIQVNADGVYQSLTLSIDTITSTGSLRVYLQGGAFTNNGVYTVKDFYIAYGKNQEFDLNEVYKFYNVLPSLQASSLQSWSGKKWNAVGDSITNRNQYQPIVTNNLGIVSQGNYGVSSSTLAVNNTYLTAQSVVERVCGLNGNTALPDADLWTIFAAVNDWLYKTPLGDINSTDNATFYGALKSICANLTGRNNHPTVILFTPLQSNRNGLNGASPNLTMLDYVKAIIDVGQFYSVPVLDLYSIGGINPVNLNFYTSDGIHPTATDGMTLLASKITKFLNRI